MSNPNTKYQPYVYKRAASLGIPVVDSKRKLFVGVVDDDVIRAKRKDSEHCALARAALRLPGVMAAYVFRSTAFIEYPTKMERFQLPTSVQKEIVSFDRAQIFASGVYQLSPMSPSSRLGPMRKRSKAKHAANSARRANANANAKAATTAHVGNRTVTGVKHPNAPEPLINKAPSRYVHRTQYVRDLKEPK